MSTPRRTEHRSFCRICNAMCGIVVTVEERDGEAPVVLRVRGDDEHPQSRGYTCPKGRALGTFHHDPRRLDTPVVRGVRTTWDTALGDIAAVVRATVDAHGPDAVGMYLASGSAFDANGRRAAERFLRVLGSRQKYTATTVDTPSKPLVAELVGGWSGLTPIWDHERSSLLVLIGTNWLVSHGHSNAVPDPVVRIREHRARGGAVWVVDPRRTETARLADRHLQPRPSTDHLVLAHLVRELLRDGMDAAYVAEHVDPADLDLLRSAVDPCTRETIAAATGLTVEDLDDLVAAVRAAGRVSGLTGTGVSMSRHANVAEWLLWALHICTGSYDRPGGMWFNPGYLMQLDTRAWAASDGVPEPGPASRPQAPRRFDEYPCSALVPEIEAGNIRVLVVAGGNPICALPGEPRLRAAFAKLDALIVLDVIDTDTTALATHVLPVAGQLERADVPWLLDAYQLAVATQYTPAVVPPAADRRPMWRAFAELGERLGLDVLPRGVTLDTATDDALLAQLAAKSRGGTEAVLAARSGTVHSGAVFGWVHDNVLPDRRWRLAPAPLVEQFHAALAESRPGGPAEGTLDGAPVLRLVPQRQLRKMNSQLRDIGERTDPELVYAHPAAVPGAQSGERVEIVSPYGRTTGVLHLDDTLDRSTVSIPHGWAGTNVCALTDTDDAIDPHTGMVWQSGIPISLRALGPAVDPAEGTR
jgi:anaerobic selenocysteine-containing dehydrogenase